MNEKVAFATSFDDLAATCSDRLMDPAWKIREYLTGVGKKAAYDKELIGRHALELIALRRKEGFHGERKDLLQLFIDSKDDNGESFPDDFLKDQVLNLAAAGKLSYNRSLLLSMEQSSLVRTRLRRGRHGDCRVIVLLCHFAKRNIHSTNIF